MPAHHAVARATRHLLATAAISTAALLGPPHITVRAVPVGARGLPADAALLVQGEHHSDRELLTVTGRAEGVQGGRRVTRPLTLAPRGKSEYVVTRQWSRGTPWVLVFAAEQGPDGRHGVAEAMVKVDAAGAVTGIEHPKSAWTDRNQPRRLTEREIRAALESLGAK